MAASSNATRIFLFVFFFIASYTLVLWPSKILYVKFEYNESDTVSLLQYLQSDIVFFLFFVVVFVVVF